jgi:hypothetical protein
MWKKPPRADEQVHSLDWEQYTAILARDKTSRVRAARTLGTVDDSDISNPELHPHLEAEGNGLALRQNSGDSARVSHLKRNFAPLYT